MDWIRQVLRHRNNNQLPIHKSQGWSMRNYESKRFAGGIALLKHDTKNENGN